MEAGEFYAVHRERPFYNDLCRYMSSGSIIPIILEKSNAVEDFRKLIGATDPAKAAEGTIRKQFATSIEANAIHGSDSDENAAIEGSFSFRTGTVEKAQAAAASCKLEQSRTRAMCLQRIAARLIKGTNFLAHA